MTHKISHFLALFSLLFLPLCGGSSLCAQEQTGEEKVDTTRVKLRGSVVDENQEPIPMVMVRIEGQGIVTTANLEGKYNISFRTADSVVVLYQMMGFANRPRLLRNAIAHCRNRGEILRSVSPVRIFCGTVASLGGSSELFRLKTFRTAILDEVSQVLEPQLLPPAHPAGGHRSPDNDWRPQAVASRRSAA